MSETSEAPEAPAADAALPPWRARWYLWDGGYLTLGRGGVGAIPLHSHHAIQVTIGLDAPVAMRGAEGDWMRGRGIVAGADVPHQLDTLGSLTALVQIDPESLEGRWLQRSLGAPIEEISAERLDRCLPALLAFHDDPPDADGTARLIHSVVRGLCAGPPPLRPPDPRIVRALQVIHRMDTARISLEEVARAVFLSPSRFAHLFRGEVGLPFRRYVLWRRLTRALLAVGRGATLSAAAHASGFADSAHLTRTSYQMYGQSPSMLFKSGEFYEIPAPFEIASAEG